MLSIALPHHKRIIACN